MPKSIFLQVTARLSGQLIYLGSLHSDQIMSLTRVNVFLCKAEIKLLLFALPALLASLAGKMIFESFAIDFPGLNQLISASLPSQDALPKYPFLIEGKARLYWMASVLVYFFVNIGFLVFLWKLFKQASRPERSYILAYLFVLTLLDILYFSRVSVLQSPISNIFYFTFDILTASAHVDEAQSALIFYVLNLINLLAVVIVPTGILVGCTLVNTRNHTLTQTRQRLNTLNSLMQIASFVMIAGLVHMQMWLSWPLYLVSAIEEIKPLKTLLMAIIQYWGICYSVTMAALFLPIAYHLHHIEHRQLDALDEQKKQDLTTPVQAILNKLPQLTSVLAPMIVGSISPAISEIFAA